MKRELTKMFTVHNPKLGGIGSVTFYADGTYSLVHGCSKSFWKIEDGGLYWRYYYDENKWNRWGNDTTICALTEDHVLDLMAEYHTNQAMVGDEVDHGEMRVKQGASQE